MPDTREHDVHSASPAADAEPEVLYDVDGNVAVIRLNRPHRLNAFTERMLGMWSDALRAAACDPEVHVVVTTGVGRGFCAGVDLDLLPHVRSSPTAAKDFLSNVVHRVARDVQALDKPLIAAINGSAMGAGLDMALMCDIRFVAASATMAEAYIRHGLVPGDGGCFFLPRLVGAAKALELLLSGDSIDADEAMRIGMVNRVYPDAELLDSTLDFAHGIARHSPIATRMIKRATWQSLSLAMETSLDLISSHFAVVAGEPWPPPHLQPASG